MDWTWGWTTVGAIATCILAGGIFVAIWQIITTRKNATEQLEAARKSTNAQVAIEMFRELRSKDNLNLLRYIYSLRPEHFKSPTKSQVSEIERAINRLDMLGALVAKDIIDEMLAIEAFAGATALRCWYQLHAYIKETQQNRGYFGENYEDFVRRSLDYFRSANRQIWFYREGEEGKVIDLVTGLQKDEVRPRRLKDIERERPIRGKDKSA